LGEGKEGETEFCEKMNGTGAARKAVVDVGVVVQLGEGGAT